MTSVLNVPWHGQPCVTCDQPLQRLWIGLDGRVVTDPSLRANVGVPCGCVQLVTRDDDEQPTLPLELVFRRSPARAVNAR